MLKVDLLNQTRPKHEDNLIVPLLVLNSACLSIKSQLFFLSFGSIPLVSVSPTNNTTSQLLGKE